ncbi:MAG: hypothetical protein MUE94_11685 [Verrucomicrobia bacterium]|jgi:hypothetical protein|nr:hypothetical protein [Verrucomicrobiota bacterium]
MNTLPGEAINCDKLKVWRVDGRKQLPDGSVRSTLATSFGYTIHEAREWYDAHFSRESGWKASELIFTPEP